MDYGVKQSLPRILVSKLLVYLPCTVLIEECFSICVLIDERHELVKFLEPHFVNDLALSLRVRLFLLFICFIVLGFFLVLHPLRLLFNIFFYSCYLIWTCLLSISVGHRCNLEPDERLFQVAPHSIFFRIYFFNEASGGRPS